MDEAYRDFFESQQIVTNSNFVQLSNETTPLLPEHIVEINSQQLVHNNDSSANSSVINFLF